MTCNTSFWTERLNKKIALLDEIDTALTGLVTGNIQSYTLDTGQTRQTVTKANLDVLQAFMLSLENQISELQIRTTGCNTVNMRQC